MTRLDADPTEQVLDEDTRATARLLIEPRDVPLGGVRGITVRRTLPDRRLPTVGAWCFLDHFAAQQHRMELWPHPHIGLQTVTWPLVGEVRHRDSRGSDVVIRPGQLDLMTSGAGIAHSEYTAGEGAADIEALQFWVALPDGAATGASGFEQHTELPVWTGTGPATGASGVVLLGEFDGVRSPATVHTPIVGAQLAIRDAVELPLDPTWEHALFLTAGSAVVDGQPLEAGPLLYLPPGRASVSVSVPSETAAAPGASAPVTVFLIGGAPFDHDLVMWWNFVARTHDEIVAARDDWEAATGRFAPVPGHSTRERIPAPPLPGVRLTPRRRRR